MVTTPLVVIGAGPYALSAAAFARRHGIETVVLGNPMSFWREHMPAGMFLRSGPDWHLDAAGVHTLEAWLAPRLSNVNVVRWPGAEVVEAVPTGDQVKVRLSNGERLLVDKVVLATGYRAALSRVPYLEGVVSDVDTAEGFPVLDESFGTSVAGLYLPGFAATRDFGPFFGFVKGAPTAATLIVQDLLARD